MSHSKVEKATLLFPDLIGLQTIINFILTVLWTGQIHGERPVSAILVAPPGAGKTSILERFDCKTARFLSDMTSRDLSPVIRDEKISHVLLGDMLAIFGHKPGVTNLTINLISRLSGDKVVSDPWQGQKLVPRMIGVVTAIPPADLKTRKIAHALEAGGFASRFIIAKYNYRPHTITKIHDFIQSDAYTKPVKAFLEIEAAKFQVHISKSIAVKIREMANIVKRDPIGARAHHHLRALVKARARMNHRSQCSMKDFEEVASFCDLFTREGKTI